MAAPDPGRAGEGGMPPPRRQSAEAIKRSIIAEMAQVGAEESEAALQEHMRQQGSGRMSTVIADREDDYKKQRFNRGLSPDRTGRTFAEIMRDRDAQAEAEAARIRENKKKMKRARTESDGEAGPAKRRPRTRWGDLTPSVSEVDAPTTTSISRDRSTRWGQFPSSTSSSAKSPLEKGRQKEKETETEKNTMLDTQKARLEAEIEMRNRPLSDADLDAMLPSTGYRILVPPEGYAASSSSSSSSSSSLARPTPDTGYSMPEERRDKTSYGITLPARQSAAQPQGQDLPELKPEDMQYFGELLKDTTESSLDEKTRSILSLLLKIKNGTPAQRKISLRQITDKAHSFGAGPLFNQILPLLMSPHLEDQERHLLVKVIDRVLFKLDDLVRPYVHKILVVIEPMLIDEDHFARMEGREIISNLSKAAGLATMIATMRPDIDNVDEYMRNTTARAFAVVASALGIPALLPFLKAVCHSRKSWQARHTGIKIVYQIATLQGCAILPHLSDLVNASSTVSRTRREVSRSMAANAVAAMATAAHPYGIECFDPVLRPLFKSVRLLKGKNLTAFMKAVGCIIPLMDPSAASFYTRHIMQITTREFRTKDDDMRKVVLTVVQNCVGTDGVEPAFVRDQIVPAYFQNFG